MTLITVRRASRSWSSAATTSHRRCGCISRRASPARISSSERRSNFFPRHLLLHAPTLEEHMPIVFGEFVSSVEEITRAFARHGDRVRGTYRASYRFDSTNRDPYGGVQLERPESLR